MLGLLGWTIEDVEHPQCILPGAPASYIFTGGRERGSPVLFW